MIYKKLNGGFVPLIVIAVIAVLAIGGGAYYTSQKEDRAEVNSESEVSLDSSTEVNLNSKNSLRGLLSLGRDLKCTFAKADTSGQTAGTVYISDGMMRGDFDTKASTGASVDSHMITKGDVSYVWSGSQGAQMTASKTEASGSPQARSVVGIDDKYDYRCVNWSKDVALFTPPASVKFMNLDVMMQGQGGAGVQTPGNNKTQINTSVDVNTSN